MRISIVFALLLLFNTAVFAQEDKSDYHWEATCFYKTTQLLLTFEPNTAYKAAIEMAGMEPAEMDTVISTIMRAVGRKNGAHCKEFRRHESNTHMRMLGTEFVLLGEDSDPRIGRFALWLTSYTPGTA